MPPSTQPQPSVASGRGGAPFNQTDHLLPPASKSPVGPIIGVIIIVALLIVGALYFWGAHLNAQNNPENNLPLILGNDSAPLQ